MKQIYLIRHGQSTSNAGKLLQQLIEGKMPEPNAQIQLTETGHHQAAEVAQWIMDRLDGDIASINVSKFLRTQQTAQPLVEQTGIAPTILDGLQEFDYLDVESFIGKNMTECRNEVEAYWLTHSPDDKHGGRAEDFRYFYDRVASVLETFKAMPAGNHVVYTHGLWISMLIWQLLGQPHPSDKAMRKFRQFELSIRARNCEVFCLTLSDAHPPAITKVRTREKCL